MITPWEVSGEVDYDRLIQEFGIEPFKPLLDQIDNPMHLMKRGIIFGHRDYHRIVEAMRNGDKFAVMSGFMPSGLPHFGHKMTMDEIVWHNRMGGMAFVGIADMEAHAVRRLSWKKTREIGMEYIKAIIALGLDENSVIYFQSANERVKNLAFELAEEVNWSELKAIYGFDGETTLAKMFVTSVQAGDILLPQLAFYGGPKPTVVPVGADQDPHIRLTRDLAARVSIFAFERLDNGVRIRSRKGREYLERLKDLDFEMKFYEEHVDVFAPPDEVESRVRELEVSIGGYAFVPPSSTYHRFITGLQGGKMSSSKPESFISLLDPPEVAGEKVKRALTGGRATAEEQRRLGGQPEKCVIFELYTIHLLDDRELEEVEGDCREGRLLCGKCKKMAVERVESFLRELQERMDEVEGRLDMYNIIS
ncbi:tryptophanyl-tRNA synthetase [Geoglobus ahangari]|uniref:Tryptophan--tRNA ligase n=1 Tax=Geoglobus ahangari TaxID=113653 RepID=A0A0F7IE13_9EURY|nr:tryptophan--tRNA ligase [Geoglobus ahangari]AKG91733.1 tryptophanyl-tRNA synthetase [Geoglobus ahangari]